eukprot:SAG31_NODE_599_length_13649_cov_9.930775_1_plen_170_part_10
MLCHLRGVRTVDVRAVRAIEPKLVLDSIIINYRSHRAHAIEVEFAILGLVGLAMLHTFLKQTRLVVPFHHRFLRDFGKIFFLLQIFLLCLLITSLLLLVKFSVFLHVQQFVLVDGFVDSGLDFRLRTGAVAEVSTMLYHLRGVRTVDVRAVRAIEPKLVLDSIIINYRSH